VTLDPRSRRQLDEQGFLVLEAVMGHALLTELRERVASLFTEEGEQAGSEFKLEPGVDRLANLVDKGDIFRRLIALPAVLACVSHVLGPALKLSSLNARRVPPYCDAAQPLHADMGAVPDEAGFWVCNTVWVLDAFARDNGALRVVPGSHRLGKLPQEVLADPKAAHPEEVLVTAPAGSVIVVNAHAWHAGTANRTAASRTAVHAFYCSRDKPQQQYQKRLLRPEVQAALSAELRELLALDDPLNDELATRDVPRSGFLK
jgi:ectoine hydroxylase-related dioxygenase (phytanoyl-CoA dioxygenase family)